MQDKILTETLSLIDEEKPLPEGWRLVRIGDVCQFWGGSQPPAHTFKRTPLTGYVRLVQIQDFRRNDFAVYIPESEARRTFDETDVMIGRYGPPVFQILRGLSGAYNVALMKTVPDESQITKDYLYHLLKLDRIQNAVIAQSERSAGQSGVNKDFLENIKIPLPPTIEEQRRIVSVLDEQMKAVEQARLAVEEQLKAANLLPNAFLRVVFESEEAQYWQKRKLGEVCSVQLGKMLSPKSKGGLTPRPYLRNANVQWSRLNLNNIATMDFSEQEAKKFELKYGDLLVCEGGEPGRAAIWREEIKPCYYQKALHRLRPLNGSINPEFLMYRLWFSANQGEFVDSNAKTTIAHLPAIRLLELPIEHPIIEEQTKIAERINEQMQAAETLKKSLTEKLEAVKKLPAALLRKAFAGEI